MLPLIKIYILQDINVVHVWFKRNNPTKLYMSGSQQPQATTPLPNHSKATPDMVDSYHPPTLDLMEGSSRLGSFPNLVVSTTKRPAKRRGFRVSNASEKTDPDLEVGICFINNSRGLLL